ncbi:MAG: hypothetical protein Salg2KO_14990 [Salibacteraceae bacterium]
MCDLIIGFLKTKYMVLPIQSAISDQCEIQEFLEVEELNTGGLGDYPYGYKLVQ